MKNEKNKIKKVINKIKESYKQVAYWMYANR